MNNAQEKKTSVQKVVVIGSSAGGRDALIRLLSQLPADFSAPIVIVQHVMVNGFADALPIILNKNSHIKCELATDNKKLKAGCAYIAPPDYHVLLKDNGTLHLAKGAPENRSRPAIDPLFRSAAVSLGPNLIAVLLTGYLDDGTSGLVAVQRCGGTTIVQDPDDASYPDMPKNALQQMIPDYCIPLAEMGVCITQELAKKSQKTFTIPKDVEKEASIADRVLSDLPTVNSLGDQVPFNCPGCGGVLWKMQTKDTLRYRCHVGHAYTADTLHEEQNRKLEETMWTALRMFEERRNLLMTMAGEQNEPIARLTKERADLSQVHIDRIRAILLTDEL
jgi:two-component system chemotaxis response regulator CheB